MKQPSIVIAVAILSLTLPARVLAAPVAKLPYEKGQSFVVAQGYDTPPTHIKKDAYAIDFTQDGCDAYGKSVVAAASGTVMFMSQEGYNGGYGTEVIIDHGGNIVSRYAHMIPDSIAVAATGTAVRQGQALGRVGDTGLVAGAACADHPGTHLHFAMDTVNADGTFSAYDPEPISGYTDVTAGRWYLSDNDEENVGATTTPTPTPAPAPATTTATAATVATATAAAAIHPTNIVFGGGTPAVSAQQTPPQQTQAQTSTSDVDASSTASSTDTDATGDATDTATSSAPSPAATGTLFAQLDDGAVSRESWYDDNWFELGNGFSGTLTALTLEGKVSEPEYFASHVTLQEFKDSGYTVMVQQFPISDDAPFTPAMATATFSGLSIRLKPYFYYRIATVQDYQNRSVLLAGTTTTATGTAMWDNFIYGTGVAYYTEPFFPYMTMDGVLATSTLTPPPITTPGNLAESFDGLGMKLNVSFSTSTDPDWPANQLHYQMNYSTSTALSDDEWTAPAPIPLVAGNSYIVGVRAIDNYGDASAVATATWNFPPGFVPYLLSPSIGYASQYFTVPSTSTLRSIQLFTANFETNDRYPYYISCSLQLVDEYDFLPYGTTPSDNGFNGYDCGAAPVFSFASSSLVLHPDHMYHWVFTFQTGSPILGASVQFYGTATDTAGGAFSDPSLANAKFTVTGDAGVMFSN